MSAMFLLSALLASAPVGLVVLVALGAAAWVFGRSPAAAAVLALGALAMGFAELVGLAFSIGLSSGAVPLDVDVIQLVHSVGWAGIGLVEMVGVVAIVIAGALGRSAPQEAP